MDAILQRLMAYLYGTNRPEGRVSIAEIRAHLAGVDENEVDIGIGLLAEKNLINLTLNRESVILLLEGKSAHEKDTTHALCFGMPYIVERHRSAVVYISVRSQTGEPTGGTGFFCADFPGWIATARHLVDERHTIVDVRDERNRVWVLKKSMIGRNSPPR